MLKILLSNFYPLSCSKYNNRDLVPGDLLFYHASSIASFISDFVSGVSSISSESIYHVAMVVESNLDSINIIHAFPGSGVVASHYKNICGAESIFNTIKVRHVDVDRHIAHKAVKIAINHIGEAYNDIFSPNFNNSKGEHSFYCSQLIQYAYNNAADSEIFPSHPMRFHEQDGKVSNYWASYFEKLNLEAPVGVNGSHPGIMYESNYLFNI
jgi:cell wall-associated NlpC family hydrolase